CNECINCRTMLENRSMDLNEIDGASNNSVDDVRALRENAKFPPIQGKYKIYIIDEVHMLSTSAFNALLKILEEPPKHLLFIFATTEPHKVPATIVSRCQRFDFHRMEISKMTEQLRAISNIENIKIDDESLFAIAKKADGSMRDAESIFDQVVSFTDGEITLSKVSVALHLIDDDFYFDITDTIVSKDLKKVFEISSEVSKRGYDYLETLQGLLEHFRNLLAVKVANSTEFLETSQYFADKYIEYSKEFETQDLIRFIQIISNSEQQLKFSPQQKIRFEIVLSLLASIPNSIDLQQLIKEIENLKSKANISALNKSQQSSQPSLSSSSTAKEKVSDDKITQEEKVVEKINENATVKLPEIISKEEIEARWNEFIDKYATKENTLTSLSNATFSFSDNLVELIAESQIVFENFNSPIRKNKIESFLKEFYGNQIKFDVIANFSPAENNKKNKTKTLETSKENINDDSNSNKRKNNNITELETAIIEIFNAKENN
ncbi:MAG TPA: DNA polymerase III subunit gamma/tau, partial [Bacteroidota bacterium]|nr:DNA polymerase III subunit gamma/tau [Bacteroidota bacterium]